MSPSPVNLIRRSCSITVMYGVNFARELVEDTLSIGTTAEDGFVYIRQFYFCLWDFFGNSSPSTVALRHKSESSGVFMSSSVMLPLC